MTLRTKKRHKMARLPAEPWTLQETGDGNCGIWLPGSDTDFECDIHITALDREVQESMARAILKLPSLLHFARTHDPDPKLQRVLNYIDGVGA